MKIDAAKISELLKEKGGKKRRQVNLYIAPDVWETFKGNCGKGMASVIVEEFMRQVNASRKKK